MGKKMNLATMLDDAKDWQKFPTTESGIFLQKLPKSNTLPARWAVSINPVDDSGRTTKRRGIIVRNHEELELLRTAVNNEKIGDLIDKFMPANPEPTPEGEQVIEL